MKSLHNTTIVVWSKSDLNSTPLHVIGHEADYGNAYCSKQDCVLIDKPEDDEDWDGTEFFGEEE